MLNRFTVTGLLTVLSLGYAFPVFAQEPESSISPSPEEAHQIRWLERQERAYQFRNAAYRLRKNIEMFHEQALQRREKLMEYRKQCWQEFRQANKYTQFSAMQKCYRGELMLDLENTRKQKLFLEELPGVSDPTKAKAIAVLDTFQEAINVVIDGIDVHVFTQESELSQTKLNLNIQYRVPYLHQLNLIEAEYLLAWTSHFMVELDDLIQDPKMSDDTFYSVSDAFLCLEDAEASLKETIYTSNYLESNMKIRQSQSLLKNCSPYLEEGYRLWKEATVSASEPSLKPHEKSVKRGLAFL